MGNILKLKRYGQISATAYGLIDDWALTYNGNQLQAVKDNATNSVYGNGTEFKDGANQTTEYTYDKNGNLVKYLNKNIGNIGYNCLNLPGQVIFGNGNSVEYEYGVDGTKLRTVHKTGSTTLTTDYCGNAVYENGVLKMLLNEAGYVSFPDKKFHFYLKDHQGNTRVVADKDGNVEETNTYYPFGGTFTSANSIQPYKYNGKELDQRNGLNWYDYGARHYDAAIGRWHSVDSLAEKYYMYNPYNYCGNNPLLYIDPDGKSWDKAWPLLQKSVSASFSIGLGVKVSTKVKGWGVEANINAGSVSFGDGPLSVGYGIGAGIGPFGIEAYDKAYELTPRVAVEESGYVVKASIIEEDHKETTYYDSTGKYYEEIGKTNTVDVTLKNNLNVSVQALIGIDITINLSDVKDFIKELFK